MAICMGFGMDAGAYCNRAGVTMDFRDTTVEQLAREIRNGERRAEQLAADTLDRIDRHNAAINAFITMVEREQVLAAARAIDRRIARGANPGALAGVPVAVKDLEDVAGLPTTYGCKLFADATPAVRDSVGVRRLRAAGAVVVGKTNTPEFGYKGSTENPLFGATFNPWHTAYSPGGSSGGSAAALAAGLVPLATGSDGGGSIRIPASACGLSGFKPSNGRVPGGDAEPPVAGLLGVRGPMARSLRDTVLALDVMKGAAAGDIFALPDDGRSWLHTVTWASPAPDIIWAPMLGFATIDDEVLQVCEVAIERLQEAGFNVMRRQQVIDDHPMPHWGTMWTAGLARTLGDSVDSDDFEQLEPELQHMVQGGLKVTGTDYVRALDACHRHNQQLEQAFADAPIILTPT